MNLEPSAGYTIDENMSISISDICDEMPGGFSYTLPTIKRI